MEQTLISVEVTEDQTIVETVKVVDVHDPFTPTTLVTEWLGDGFFRSAVVPEVPQTVTAARFLGVGEGAR